MKRSLTALTISALLLCSACAPSEEEDISAYRGKKYGFYAFTVPVTVALYTDYGNSEMATKAENFATSLNDLFSSINDSLSVSVPTSSIAKFNKAKAGETIEIDKIAYTVLEKAKMMYELTNGIYNPAVGLSVDLWGFTPRFNIGSGEDKPYDREQVGGRFVSLPDTEYITAFQTVSDFSLVTLSQQNGKYYVKKPDLSVTVEGVEYTMQIDLGGIGKGYAADEGDRFMCENGYNYGYLNVGKSSIAMKRSIMDEDDFAWNLGFRHPRAKGNYCSVTVKDVMTSTSGDYENFYMIDGVRYAHIIDPTTGCPFQSDVMTASVTGLPAAESDALTTAILIMGSEKAIPFLKTTFPSVNFIIMTEDMTLYTNFTSVTLVDETITLKKV